LCARRNKYWIQNIELYFTISECVKCKHCGDDITFKAKVYVDSDLKFKITIAKQFIQAMNIAVGSNAYQYASVEGLRRIIRVEHIAQDITKEAKLRRRQTKFELIEDTVSAEDSLYDPEVNDSM